MVAAVMAASLFHIPYDMTGIYPGAPFYCRLTYHFVHVSLLHALVNCWCFLCIIFRYDIRMTDMLSAFFIAASFPVNTLSSIIPPAPTVGMSGICFALLGRISFSVSRKLYFQIWMSLFLSVGFLFPGTNAWLHLYCYLCGLLLSFLNKPAR